MFSEIGVHESGAAKCLRCNKRIEPDEVRVWSPAFSEWMEPFSYHLRCAVDADPSEALELLRGYEETLADKSALIALAEAALAERERENALRAKGPVDVSKLPRARVYLAGSAASNMSTIEEMQRLAPELRWPSALRLYRFVVVRTGEALPPEDVDEPYVATVFAVYGDARVVANQKQKLADWKAQGFGAPVLWVFARGAATAATDAEITKLREVLDAAGFVGDEARVCSTRVVDRAALDALVAAIDESTGLGR